MSFAARVRMSGLAGAVWIALVGALATGCAEYERPLAWREDVRIVSYDASIQIDLTQRALTAETLVRLVRDPERETLDGRFAGMFDSVLVDGKAVAHRRSGNHFRLWMPSGADSADVRFFYTVQPPHGAYFGGSTRPSIFFTDSWPERMTGWIPVFDHPAAAVQSTMRITVPPGMTAVASGRLASIDTTDAGVLFRYELTASVPLYTVAAAAGDLRTDTLRAGDHTCISYASPAERQSRALHDACSAVAFFDSLIAPYPFPQYGVVAVPMHHLGMENAGLSFVRSDVFSGSPGHSFFERPAAVQAHEAAHQWFGNSVMIREWSDLWISEGFSTYLTLLYFEHQFGADAFREGLAELVDTGARRNRQTVAVVRPDRKNPDDHLNLSVYRRGASVLHLLRLKIGEKQFLEVLRHLYDRFAGHNVTTEEVINAVSAYTADATEDFLRFWLYSSRNPVLHTDWDAATRTLSWHVTGDDGTLAGLPFEMRLSSGDRDILVTADRGRIALVGWGAEKPTVTPYGVFLDVR